MDISFLLTGFLKASCNLIRQVWFPLYYPNIAVFPTVKNSLWFEYVERNMELWYRLGPLCQPEGGFSSFLIPITTVPLPIISNKQWGMVVVVVVFGCAEHTGFLYLQHTGLVAPSACGILVPWPGIESTSPALEGEFLTTGPLGKSLNTAFAFQKTPSRKAYFLSLLVINSFPPIPPIF